MRRDTAVLIALPFLMLTGACGLRPVATPDGIPSSASGPGATQTAVFLTRSASWSEIEALRHLSQFEELGERTVKRILEDNPAALYGLS